MVATAPTVTFLRRKRLQTECFREPLAPEHDPELRLTLVQIPWGNFLIGSPNGELERARDEGPQQEIKLSEFWMAQTPITQAQWRAVAQWQPREGEHWGRQLKANPARFQPKDRAEEIQKQKLFGSFCLLEGETTSDQRPVESVSWWDAMEFCHRLSQRTGRSYRLPSEAQWEYACRAASTTPFAFGETLTAELANYRATATYANGPEGEFRQQTTPVGMFPANRWGLHDMHGNVQEWCLDQWHDNYQQIPKDGSPWVEATLAQFLAKKPQEITPEDLRHFYSDADSSEKQPRSVSKEPSNQLKAKRRLLRGGSWDDYPGSCRSAYRDRFDPDDADFDVGFRVVCLPQGPSLDP